MLRWYLSPTVATCSLNFHGIGLGPLLKKVAVNEQVTFCTTEIELIFFSFLFMRNTAKKTNLAVVNISTLLENKINNSHAGLFHQKSRTSWKMDGK